MRLTQEQFTRQALSQLIPFITEKTGELPKGLIYIIHDEYLISASTNNFNPEELKVIKYGGLKEKIENSEENTQKPLMDQIENQFETMVKNPEFVGVIPMSESTYAAKTQLQLTREYRNKPQQPGSLIVTAYGKR